jgi:hypothetical protein
MKSIRPSEESKSWILVNLNYGPIKVPIFPFSEVPRMSCAGHVRRAAQEMFDKQFTTCDAWNRRYHDRLVLQIPSGTRLGTLAHQGILREGMIIGVHNPGSHYLAERDETGKVVQYTHNALYLGRDPRGNPILTDLFEDIVFVRNEQEFLDAGLTPMEIFDEK